MFDVFETRKRLVDTQVQYIVGKTDWWWPPWS